jgi:hypothetical protein
VLRPAALTVAAGRLRYVKEGECRVTADTDAWIRPFAQCKTVDMIIGGIAPDLQDRLIEIIGQFPSGKAGKRAKNAAPERIEKVRAAVEAEVQDKYAQPLMAAVAALPRGDLAVMAEALVSLTAFRARMSVTEKNTSAGRSTSLFSRRARDSFGSTDRIKRGIYNAGTDCTGS